MKYFVWLIVIVSGYYLYDNKDISTSQFEVKSHRDIYIKLKSSPVSTEEILVGATEFAATLCNDTSFQQPLGETTSSCLNKLESFKNMCSESVFGKESRMFTDKDTVASLAKRFIGCVGTL
ncbi:hypothetical protein [Thalassotalea ganghwensis]